MTNCANPIGIGQTCLPEILEADAVGGKDHCVRRPGVSGLTAGTPMLVGSDGHQQRDAAPRCAPRATCSTSAGRPTCWPSARNIPRPDEKLLTRAVGVGRRWMQVSTLAAAGSALVWANRELCPRSCRLRKFHALVRRLAKRPVQSAVRIRTLSWPGTASGSTRDRHHSQVYRWQRSEMIY